VLLLGIVGVAFASIAWFFVVCFIVGLIQHIVIDAFHLIVPKRKAPSVVVAQPEPKPRKRGRRKKEQLRGASHAS
jgi:cell division protein FtsN